MPSRRRFLLSAAGALTGLGVLAGCASPGGAASASKGIRVDYGTDPSQFGELTLPGGTGRRPVVVVLHGGFWRSSYGLELGRPLAADLAAAGVAVWNVEYRRVAGALSSTGGGGGWPATGLDVAAATDALAGPVQQAAAGRLDLDQVLAIGHSAGGQLAAWLAARPRLGAGLPGSRPAVRVRGVVSQAGVLDLIEAARTHLGGSSTQNFLGGSPAECPDAYAQASPAALVPIGVPVVCVHGRDDSTVPLIQSERFVAADSTAGGKAKLIPTDGDHFAIIDVSTPAWQTCRTHLLAMLD